MEESEYRKVPEEGFDRTATLPIDPSMSLISGVTVISPCTGAESREYENIYDNGLVLLP